MKIEIIGKNGFEPSKAVEEYFSKKVTKVTKLIDDIQDIRGVMKTYPQYHKIEVTLRADHLTIRAEDKAIDMYAAIDLVIDKLVLQINKFKKRLEHRQTKKQVKMPENTPVDALEKEVLAEQLVRNKKIALQPMTIEDAIEQLELLDHDFFVYLDKHTLQTHVVYKREDGDYAVIETKNV
jgi:putative sigma-54 modulation protein